MMLRPLCAVTAGLTLGLIGMRYAARLRSEASRLRAWDPLLDRLQLLLSEAALPLPDALEQAASSHSEPDMLFRTLAKRLRAEPLSSLSTLFDAQQYSYQEQQTIASLMAELDRGSLESRLLCIAHARSACAQLAKAAAEHSDRDASMWAKIGWTGGACLTLLLI